MIEYQSTDIASQASSADTQDAISVTDSEISEKYKTIRDSISASVVAAEILPVNEAIRGAIIGATVLATSNNMLAVAGAAGGSTLFVEGAAAIAAARLLTSDKSKNIYRGINKRLSTIGINEDDKISTVNKVGAALLGGSVVAMAIERRDRDDITKEGLRKYGLKTSTWLAGTLAVAGAAASEGIDITKERPIFGAAVVASLGALAVGRVIRRHNKVSKQTPETLRGWRIDSDKYGISYGLVEDDQSLAKAAELEQDVWDEEQYGNLEEEGYTKYKSRVFAAFNTNGECVGMNRMFQADESSLQPFLGMEFYDQEERDQIVLSAKNGDTEELGTVAVAKNYRGKKVNLRLWRLAYRDARIRGIKQWGIIMEPERVEKMNKNYGFKFRQLGPAVDYQGGDCAPFIMDLQEVNDKMQKEHKINYFWFVNKKLKK